MELTDIASNDLKLANFKISIPHTIESMASNCQAVFPLKAEFEKAQL